jgi:hypothetical protein
MNHLLSVRSNELFSKDGDTYKRFLEIIFLVDQPGYRSTNEGVIIRERLIKELRFTISDKNLDDLINLLTSMKNEPKPQ